MLMTTHISEELKIKLFTTHIECILLYSSELWTLTKTLEQQIDSFHCGMLRNVIGIHWPEWIRNIDLYERTKENPWSTKIFKEYIYFNYIGSTSSKSLAQSLQKYEVPTRETDIDIVEVSDERFRKVIQLRIRLSKYT